MKNDAPVDIQGEADLKVTADVKNQYYNLELHVGFKAKIDPVKLDGLNLPLLEKR